MRDYQFHVYILRCCDGSYYIGVTNDIDRRFAEHRNGIDPTCYTFGRRLVTLVYTAWFTDIWKAIAWEKHIKRWSRKKKGALIRGEVAPLDPHLTMTNCDSAMSPSHGTS